MPIDNNAMYIDTDIETDEFNCNFVTIKPLGIKLLLPFSSDKDNYNCIALFAQKFNLKIRDTNMALSYDLRKDTLFSWQEFCNDYDLTKLEQTS